MLFEATLCFKCEASLSHHSHGGAYVSASCSCCCCSSSSCLLLLLLLLLLSPPIYSNTRASNFSSNATRPVAKLRAPHPPSFDRCRNWNPALFLKSPPTLFRPLPELESSTLSQISTHPLSTRGISPAIASSNTSNATTTPAFPLLQHLHAGPRRNCNSLNTRRRPSHNISLANRHR